MKNFFYDRWYPGATWRRALPKYKSAALLLPHRWCLHLIVVLGFEWSRDPESYAGGSVATGRATSAGQVKV
jgi:hypothetical protein